MFHGLLFGFILMLCLVISASFVFGDDQPNIVLQTEEEVFENFEKTLKEIRGLVHTDLPRADSLARKVLVYTTISRVDSLKAKAFLFMGNLNYFKGLNISARQYYEQARNTRYFHQNKRFRTSVLNNLGAVYQLNGDLSRAMESYRESIEISWEMQDSISIYQSYINIGKLQLSQGKNGSGKEYLLDALEYFERRKDTLHMALCYHNLMESGGNVETGLEYFKRAAGLYNAVGNIRGLAEIYVNYSNDVLRSGDVEKARHYLTELEQLKTQLSDENVMANIELIRARYQIRTNEFEEAEQLLLKIKTVFEKLGVASLNLDVYYDLGVLYALQQQPVKSQLWFEKYAEAMKNLFNQKRARELAEFDALLQQSEKIAKEKSLQEQGYYKSQINHLGVALGIIVLIGLAIILFLVIKMHSRSIALYNRNMELARLMEYPLKDTEGMKNGQRKNGQEITVPVSVESKKVYTGNGEAKVKQLEFAGGETEVGLIKEEEENESVLVQENGLDEVSGENHLDDEQAFFNELFIKIKYYVIEEKVFLNPELRIGDLAYEMATNEKYVSLAFQYGSGQRFSPFINLLRVNEAKKYLSNSKYDSLSMQEIARKTGFRSQSTFLRQFKEFTGMNPLSFKKIGNRYEEKRNS